MLQKLKNANWRVHGVVLFGALLTGLLKAASRDPFFGHLILIAVIAFLAYVLLVWITA